VSRNVRVSKSGAVLSAVLLTESAWLLVPQGGTKPRHVHVPRASDWDCAYLIDPLLRFSGCPDEKQPFNGRERVGLLRDNEQTWAGIASDEFGELHGHGLPVVGNKDSPILPSQRQRLHVI